MVPSYLEKARSMALKSVAYQFRVGAVIANGSHILGMGRNKPNNHKARFPGYRSVHAELDAILKSRGDLKGSTVYVVVINSCGNEVVSKPCDLCMEMLRSHGVSTVVYSRRGIMCQERID